MLHQMWCCGLTVRRRSVVLERWAGRNASSVVVLTAAVEGLLNNRQMTLDNIKHTLPQWRGDESAQRKRFLKSEEAALAENFGPNWRDLLAEQLADKSLDG